MPSKRDKLEKESNFKKITHTTFIVKQDSGHNLREERERERGLVQYENYFLLCCSGYRPIINKYKNIRDYNSFEDFLSHENQHELGNLLTELFNHRNKILKTQCLNGH
jgi:hypothetical protein